MVKLGTIALRGKRYFREDRGPQHAEHLLSIIGDDVCNVLDVAKLALYLDELLLCRSLRTSSRRPSRADLVL